MIPSEKVGAVVLTNLGGAAVAGLAEQLVGDVLGVPLLAPSSKGPLPIKTSYVVAHDDLPKYQGSYKDGGTRVNIAVDGERLIATTFDEDGTLDKESPIVGIGDNLFMVESSRYGNEGRLVYFVKNADGDVTSLLIGGAQYWRV